MEKGFNGYGNDPAERQARGPLVGICVCVCVCGNGVRVTTWFVLDVTRMNKSVPYVCVYVSEGPQYM